MKIKRLMIQPSTMGELVYVVGENNPLGDGVVTAIKIDINPVDDKTYLEIKVDDELYAQYFDVPFAVFYK